MGIYFKDEKFNLKKAIINDEVDLIFGESQELIEESYKHNGENKMQMLIRNKEEDTIDHDFTMKFTPQIGERKDDKNFYHKGHYGLPITFSRENKNWSVHLGKSTDKVGKAKSIEKTLKKREKAFITATVEEIGDEILDYWEVENTHTPEGKRELANIVERIRDKYEK